MTVTTNPPPPGLPPNAARILMRCMGYLRPYGKLTGAAYLVLLVTTALTLVTPQIIRVAIDRGVRGAELDLLRSAVFAILGLTVIKSILAFLTGRWTEIASQGVAYDLRNALYRKLAALSFSYHDRAQVGQLLSRAIQDVDRIRFVTGRAFLRLAEGLILLLGAIVFQALMNPYLTFLALWTMPLLAYWAMRFGRTFRPVSLAVQQQLAVLTTYLEQNLRGARVVKAFAQEPAEMARFDVENDRWFDLSARAARMQALNMPFLDLVANLGTVFIIWYGGSLVIGGRLTLGELVAFSTYMGLLIQPVRRLGMILPALVTAAAGGERIFEILDVRSEVTDAPGAAALPPIRGHVRFEHVSFSYFGRHQVLNDVSFEAQPGQVIALLGPTGSGKSSIINLIPRFYDPTRGRITVDGQDIRAVQLASLRDQIGIVLQETTLFAATMRANIAFGRPDASEEEIIAAAQAAQAHDFIMEMPQGYDTTVGERGVTLSGGQKQRVAIARALLKDPHILIFDDATASVDSDTERLIQVALARLMTGRTSFVIAQRLSTIRMADQILVLDGGRITARGTHDELLRTSELYVAIYQRQFRPQERAISLETGAAVVTP